MFAVSMLNLTRSWKALALPIIGLSLLTLAIATWDSGLLMHAQSLAPILPLPETSFGLPPVAALTKDKQSPLRDEIFGYLRVFDRGNEAHRAQAIKSLRQRESSLPPSLQIAMRLSIARTLAGLSVEGRRLRPANKNYQEALRSASNLIGKLPLEERHWAFRYSLAVWQKAEGRTIAWDRVPFKLNGFAALPEAKALVERSALQDLKNDRVGAAERKYRALSRAFAGTPTKATIDLRVLDLQRAAFKKGSMSRPYENALVRAAKEYLDPGVLGPGNEARVKSVGEEIDARHLTLVMGLLDKGTKSPADRPNAISTAERFLGALREGTQLPPVKAKLAEVYYLAGRHGRAVALYKELAGTGQTPDEKRYLAFAIRSQNVLASWTGEVPWQGIKRGNTAAREELFGLYKLVRGDESQRETSHWFVVAHMGLLGIDLGRGEEAFKDWTAQIGAAPQGTHAAHAAGYMMTAYEKAAQYDSLETVARLCLAQHVTPIHRSNTLNPRLSLALALIEQGKKSLESQDFKVATAKLEELVKTHGDFKRHDEGLYLLAFAYRGLSRHDEAIKARVTFAERYPQSTLSRDALLTGSSWSTAMAYEENTIFFKERFLTAFARDEEAPGVRDQLLNLYLGRELYAQALRVLSRVAKDSRSDGPTKAAALSQMLRIEEQHGSLERATEAADQLVATPGVTNELLAQGYGFKARFFAKSASWGEVDRIEARLAGLGDEVPVREALAEIRFQKAIRVSQNVVQKVFNLELQDPYATLNQRYQAFLRARTQFTQVCDTGATSWCVPAMTQLSALAAAFLQSTEDIEIQPTLAAGVVQRFRDFKQKVDKDGADTVQASEAKFASAVRSGYTNPEWVRAAAWQQNSDWSLERLTGEDGRGFVQWSEDSEGAQP